MSDRLARVNDQMQAMAGELQRVLVDMRKELGRLNFGSLLKNELPAGGKSRRGRPPKSASAETSRVRPPTGDASSQGLGKDGGYQ